MAILNKKYPRFNSPLQLNARGNQTEVKGKKLRSSLSRDDRP